MVALKNFNIFLGSSIYYWAIFDFHETESEGEKVNLIKNVNYISLKNSVIPGLRDFNSFLSSIFVYEQILKQKNVV